ncbi:preprotein translocase subunit SecG [bacterium]|nr:MAG: preprotein translocase subunit SecG [bacterium]
MAALPRVIALQTAYTVFLILGVLVAIPFIAIVMLTGKGDAMSGGGSVRTSFRGKASFDDIMSRYTLILGAAFMVLMILVDAIGNHLNR